MRKNILLVIFFFALICSIIIYKISYEDSYRVLYIGENKKELLDNNYETFLYDNITYKELINMIKNNDYYIMKNKNIYLNQLISSADKIIINANNVEYKKRCKNNKITKGYMDVLKNNKNELKNLILRFSNAKIVFVNNNC